MALRFMTSYSGVLCPGSGERGLNLCTNCCFASFNRVAVLLVAILVNCVPSCAVLFVYWATIRCRYVRFVFLALSADCDRLLLARCA